MSESASFRYLHGLDTRSPARNAALHHLSKLRQLEAKTGTVPAASIACAMHDLRRASAHTVQEASYRSDMEHTYRGETPGDDAIMT